MRQPARRVRSGAVVLVLAAALLLAACSSGSPGPSRSSAGAGSARSTDALTISNFMFSPMTASVAPGATVTVTNKDSVTHTLTATGGAFTTGDIGPGRSKTFRAPTKAGSYGYICDIHQYMKGTIVVR